MSSPRKNTTVIALDLGGTHMQAAVVEADHRIIARTHRPTLPQRGADAVIDDLAAAARAACVDARIDLNDLGGVGIAAAGAIDSLTGRVLQAPNLGWTDVPLRDALSARLGIGVTVENDVNAAAFGEFHCGAGRPYRDLLAVWVGTGIGGGLVLGDQLFRGVQDTAGEIGQTVMRPDSPPGKRTLEQVASRTGIICEVRSQRNASHLDTRSLADAYLADDPTVSLVIDDAARLLGIAIANWVTVLALPAVVLGGGMTEVLGDRFLDGVRKAFDGNVFPDRAKACRLLRTELEADAGLLGAAILAGWAGR